MFAHGPEVSRWNKFLSGLDSLIMKCCMPRYCHHHLRHHLCHHCDVIFLPYICRGLTPEKTQHGRHIQQHCIQLIYEIILLVVACVEHKYIELFAIVAGILGSLMGLIHMHMLDVVLNMFALVSGFFLFINSLTRFKYVHLLLL